MACELTSIKCTEKEKMTSLNRCEQAQWRVVFLLLAHSTGCWILVIYMIFQ